MRQFPEGLGTTQAQLDLQAGRTLPNTTWVDRKLKTQPILTGNIEVPKAMSGGQHLMNSPKSAVQSIFPSSKER